MSGFFPLAIIARTDFNLLLVRLPTQAPNLDLERASAISNSLKIALDNTDAPIRNIVNSLRSMSSEIDLLVQSLDKEPNDLSTLTSELERIKTLCQSAINAEAFIS